MREPEIDRDTCREAKGHRPIIRRAVRGVLDTGQLDFSTSSIDPNLGVVAHAGQGQGHIVLDVCLRIAAVADGRGIATT